MAAAEKIEVSPELVRWARESGGLDIEAAAKKIHIAVSRLKEWESETATPSVRQLERMADAYKRPVVSFFLPMPPHEPPLPIDFRTHENETVEGLSFGTRLAVRRARNLNKSFVELTEDVKEVKLPKLNTNNVRESARLVRAWIGADEVSVFGSPEEALRAWRRKLETAGLLVFQFPMPQREARAFSMLDIVPTIVLSSKDAPAGRVFSLFHELTHLALGRPGICNPTFEHKGRDKDIEVFCNAVSAEVLVPEDRLVRKLGSMKPNEKGSFAASLVSLAKAFGVSRFVIARRLLDLGKVSRIAYKITIKELDKQFVESQQRRKEGFAPPPTMAVSELGKSFIAAVLSAREVGRLSDMAAAEILGVRLKHIPKLESMVEAY